MPVQKFLDIDRVLVSSGRIIKKKNSISGSLNKQLADTVSRQKSIVANLNSGITSLKIKSPTKDEKTILSSLKQLQGILTAHEENLDEQIHAINEANSYLLAERMIKERQIVTSSYVVTNELKSTKIGFLANKKLDLKSVASSSSTAMATIAVELLNLNEHLKKNQLKKIDERLNRIKVYTSSLK